MYALFPIVSTGWGGGVQSFKAVVKAVQGGAA